MQLAAFYRHQGEVSVGGQVLGNVNKTSDRR
jgi:hypothetical protein